MEQTDDWPRFPGRGKGQPFFQGCNQTRGDRSLRRQLTFPAPDDQIDISKINPGIGQCAQQQRDKGNLFGQSKHNEIGPPYSSAR